MITTTKTSSRSQRNLCYFLRSVIGGPCSAGEEPWGGCSPGDLHHLSSYWPLSFPFSPFVFPLFFSLPFLLWFLTRSNSLRVRLGVWQHLQTPLIGPCAYEPDSASFAEQPRAAALQSGLPHKCEKLPSPACETLSLCRCSQLLHPVSLPHSPPPLLHDG